ncbi:MAG: MotA/TolQ/ExbB proton channel family protein [Kiritimatiellales bacterium]|nr:MotA/TolQ/ExbB proton channel family protein [Pontiella sp.]NNJ71137.1 MotA/TolQ/ExbB proton channel family protein [Kiritimatiellales bacterium]
MYDLILKGGPIMWPLVACSGTALAIVFERGIFWLLVSRKKNQALINRLFTLTEEGDFETAISEGSVSSCLVCRILSNGLSHRNYGLVQSLEAAAMFEIEKMKRYLSVLDTIITAAPLLGILGTVSGIIISFDLLGDAGIADPKAVTGGIAQALITTAAGLSIAIATLLPYNALTRKVEKVTRYLEQLITCYEVTVQKGMEKQCS